MQILEKIRIITKLVEKKIGFLFGKDVFSVGSPNREDPLLPSSTMPEQKSIRLAKKGGDPPFLKAGFRRFSPDIPFPPRLFAETKRGELDSFLPALFVFGACFFARATRKRVLTTNQIGDESIINNSFKFHRPSSKKPKEHLLVDKI